MKKWFLAVALALCALVPAHADDVADARNAFDEFCLYTRTANEQLPELFAPDISVTVTVQPEHGPARDTVLPSSTFLGLVRQNVARKESSHDTYKDIKTTPEGDTVKITATRVDEKTGFTGPFLAIYGKNAAGRYVMKAMKFTTPPPRVTSDPSPTPTPPPTDVPAPLATP